MDNPYTYTWKYIYIYTYLRHFVVLKLMFSRQLSVTNNQWPYGLTKVRPIVSSTKASVCSSRSFEKNGSKQQNITTNQIH